MPPASVARSSGLLVVLDTCPEFWQHLGRLEKARLRASCRAGRRAVNAQTSRLRLVPSFDSYTPGLPLTHDGLVALTGLAARDFRPTSLTFTLNAGAFNPGVANLGRALQLCGASVKRLELIGRLPACTNEAVAALTTHLPALTDLDLDLTCEPGMLPGTKTPMPSAVRVAGSVISALTPRLQALTLRGLDGWAPHMRDRYSTTNWITDPLSKCRGLRRLELDVQLKSGNTWHERHRQDPPPSHRDETAKLRAAFLPAIRRLTALTHLSIAGTWPWLRYEETEDRSVAILRDQSLKELRPLSALTKLQTLRLGFDDAPADASMGRIDIVSRSILAITAPLSELRCLDLDTLPLTYDTCRTLGAQHPGLTELAFGRLAAARADAAAAAAAPFPPHMPSVPLPPSLRLLRLCASAHRLRDLAALAPIGTAASTQESTPAPGPATVAQGPAPAGRRLVLLPAGDPEVLIADLDDRFRRPGLSDGFSELDPHQVAEQLRVLARMVGGPVADTAPAAGPLGLAISTGQHGYTAGSAHSAWLSELAPPGGSLERLQLRGLALAEGDLTALAQAAPSRQELKLTRCSLAGPQRLVELAPLCRMTALHIIGEDMQDLLAVPGSEEALWALARGLGAPPPHSWRSFCFETLEDERFIGEAQGGDAPAEVPRWFQAKGQALLQRLHAEAHAEGLQVSFQLRSFRH